MRQNISKPALFSLCFILISFSSLLSQSISNEVERELDKTGDQLTKFLLAGEYLSLLDYYSEDLVVMPGLQPTVRGKKALLKQYKDGIKKGIKYHSFTGNVEKRWQYGDEIFERGSLGMAVSSNTSNHPVAYYGSYFQIWQKQADGSYKISFNIWNLDFNPYE